MQVRPSSTPNVALCVDAANEVNKNRVGAAVVFRQQIDQQIAGLAGKPDREQHLARLLVEIVHEQHRVIAPVVADHQYGRSRALIAMTRSCRRKPS